MKKVRIIILFMTLLLGMFFFMPVGVSAYTYNPDKNGQDFTPYKNDIYYCELEQHDIYVYEDGTVLVIIRDGLIDQFQFHKETDFSSVFLPYLFPSVDGLLLRDVFGVDKIYWNPWQQLWQLEYPVASNITAVDWINHISQFEYGFAKGEIDNFGWILIVEEPGHEYEGYQIYYYSWDIVDYFDPEIAGTLTQLVQDGEGVLWWLEEKEDFDGYLYWNFEQGYWQIEYYEISELDYYKQRVDDLEDEISSLEDEISSLEDEISSLEDEISSLEDEISSLEDALDLEYDRGYNDGYEIGYSEGLLVENNDIDIIKWFVPLVVIIIVVGVFESIKIFKRRDE